MASGHPASAKITGPARKLLCWLALTAGFASSATAYTWTPPGAGTYNWDDATSNWTSGFPNGIDDIANLNIDLAAAQTINLNQAITAGTINLGDSAGTYYGVTIAGNGGSLIMDVASGTAAIARTNGNSATDTISADILLNDDLLVSDVTGSFGWVGDGNSNSLTLSGNISGVGKSITVNGGVVRLKGTNDFSGGVTLNSGTLAISNQALGTGTLTINGGWINGINGGESMSQNNPMIWNNDFGNGMLGFNMGTGAITLTKPITISNFHGVDIGGAITGPGGLNVLDVSTRVPGGANGGTVFSNKEIIPLRAGGQTVTVISWGEQIDGIIDDGDNGYSLTKAGDGGLTLTGINTYAGDTVVSAGSLTLSNGGSTKFKVTDSGSNKITGAGTVAMNGAFDIDTSAVTAIAGSWILVDVGTLSETYGSTFSVTGYTKDGSLWTKTDGAKTWVFNPSTGILALPAAWITSFTYGTAVGVIDQNAKTISLTVPNGTNPATVNPTFTLYSGTCTDQTSGSPPSPTFAVRNPATYTVTDSGTGITRIYAVTLTVSPPAPGGVGAGLALWLDASAASTMTLSGGSTVTEWRDAFGGTGKATILAGAPTLVAAGIGGIPTVHFDTSSGMNDGVNRSAGPVTIFYVSRQTGGTNQRVLTASSNNWLMGYWGGNRNSFYYEGWVNMGPGTDANPHLFATTIGGSGQNSTVYAEGNLVASNQGGTRGPNDLTLNGYGERSDCDISEVVVYDRVLTSVELNSVGGYLTAKYGLTTSYPGPAEIVSFGVPGYDGVINQAAKTITLTVPTGSSLATLAPSFTLTSGTCTNQTSGSPPSPTFAVQNPATYTIQDGAVTNTYYVTATVVSPYVLFSDDFNRGSSTPLNGSLPKIVNPTYYPSGLTWQSTGSGHNSTTAGQPETGGWNGMLSFTPEAGQKYLLTLEVGPTIQNALHIGFGRLNGGIGDYDFLTQNMYPVAGAKIGQINDYGNYNPGTSTAYSYTAGPGDINTVSILLDTSSGLATAALTLSVNGETKGAWVADVSTYHHVGFGRGDGPNDPNGTQIRSISLSLVPELDPYNQWSGGALFSDDLNSDGVENGLAWLLGAANPSANSCGLLPQASRTPAGKLALRFLCLKPDKRGTAMLAVEYSNDLGLADPWRTHHVAVPDTSLSSGGIAFTIAETDPVSDYYAVTAEITEGAASAGGKLFGRVSATP